MIDRARAWFKRCGGRLPADKSKMNYPEFPGFEAVFRSAIHLDARWTVAFDGSPSELERAINECDTRCRFERVLEVYAAGIRRLARFETTKPDVVLCCLSDDVVEKCWSVDNSLTKEEKAAAEALRKATVPMTSRSHRSATICERLIDRCGQAPQLGRCQTAVRPARSILPRRGQHPSSTLCAMPTQFRLVRYGVYPPNRGTLCVVNGSAAYLFTTGYMPELGTYPEPHIPAPARIMSDETIDLERAAQDILGLTRINWNTAGTTGGHPVTLSFARRVGGIMAEYGDSLASPA